MTIGDKIETLAGYLDENDKKHLIIFLKKNQYYEEGELIPPDNRLEYNKYYKLVIKKEVNTEQKNTLIFNGNTVGGHIPMSKDFVFPFKTIPAPYIVFRYSIPRNTQTNVAPFDYQYTTDDGIARSVKTLTVTFLNVGDVKIKPNIEQENNIYYMGENPTKYNYYDRKVEPFTAAEIKQDNPQTNWYTAIEYNDEDNKIFEIDDAIKSEANEYINRYTLRSCFSLYKADNPSHKIYFKKIAITNGSADSNVFLKNSKRFQLTFENEFIIVDNEGTARNLQQFWFEDTNYILEIKKHYLERMYEPLGQVVDLAQGLRTIYNQTIEGNSEDGNIKITFKTAKLTTNTKLVKSITPNERIL